jgi:hypothetical protein
MTRAGERRDVTYAAKIEYILMDFAMNEAARMIITGPVL